MTQQCVNCPGAEDHSTAQCPLVSAQKNELRQIITDALGSMVSGVTGLVPPSGPGQIPDFIQAPVDRAVERISASLPVGVPGAEPVLIQAVAVTRDDEEEGLRLEWLLEGGIAEMEFAGQVLFAMPEANSLCDEDGSAHVYIAPPPAPTVKAEQVQCSTCNDTALIGDLPIECPDCCHDESPSLPAAGSAVEEVDIPNISYALRERLLGQLAGDHEPEEMLCVEDFYSWLAKAIDNIRAEYRKAEGSKPVQVYASAALSAQQSAPVTNETSPLEVIGYASPGQIAILRELPRTGGMKVKGRKDDRYSEPVVLLSDARSAMLSLAVRCQQEGAFKTCLECGYQDGHDEICQFHASNRMAQQSAPDSVSVPVELLQDLHDLASDAVEHHRAAFAGYKLKRQANMDHAVDKARALLASHAEGGKV